MPKYLIKMETADVELQKLISPIVYVCFLIPITIVVLVSSFTIGRIIPVIFIKWIDNLIEVHQVGLVPILIMLTIVGPLIFWFANKFLVKAEKLSLPTIIDHFRQSAGCYAIILALYLKVVYFNKYHLGLGNDLGGGIIQVMIKISVIAIFTNALYLFWISRKLNTSPSTKIGLSVFVGPAVAFLLLLAGRHAYNEHNREYYHPSPRVLSPNEAANIEDIRSTLSNLSGMPTSTTIVDTTGTTQTKPDLRQ